MKKYESLNLNDVLSDLNHVVQQGLTKQESQKRFETYGANTLNGDKGKSILQHILASFKDITIIILLVAVILSTYVALTNHPDNLTEPLVITGIIILNIILSVREQVKAEKSMEALKEYNVQKSKVLRDGKIEHIDSEVLVPGDIILLSTGDRIPADARIIDELSLLVDESLLTGESEPVSKDAYSVPDEHAVIADRKHMIFSGSLVVAGKCTAVITRTGTSTEIGRISKLLAEEHAGLSPLQIRMQKLGKTLSIVAIIAALFSLVIGWMYGYDITSMLMVAISVAVAAIPEVMPVVVTISLSYGISNMAKKNTIVRTPTAVETVGNVSVICSDKTGTLTQNKMRIEKVWTTKTEPKDATDSFNEDEYHLLKLLLLASSPEVIKDSTIGNPTELSIANLAKAKIKNLSSELNEYEKIHEIPFDSTRKRMTVLYKTKGGYCSITKGAIDRLPVKYSDALYRKIQSVHDSFAGKALRVIGVAYKYYAELPQELDEAYLENDLTFYGLVGIIDPPRVESAHAVQVAKEAGIKTVMITGDHLNTAKAIAKEIGILYGDKKIMDGSTLNAMSDQELENVVGDYRVFARTSPEDKIRIVKAFQKTGEIVAMTGDGVNDAPALKAADVGIAMGSGTDVAKEASDMILLDDNFSTIVTAVQEGRRVYSNIRKSIYAMLGCNVSAVTIVLLSLIFGWGAPVTAIQLLIIKVVADGIPGFSLCVEKAEPDIMKQSPIKKGTSIFADGMINKIITISVVFTIATLLSVYIGSRFDIGDVKSSPAIAQSMTFVVMGLTTIVHMYNCRSHLSIFKINFTSNKLLLSTTIMGTIIMAALTMITPLAKVLNLVSLNFWHWVLIILLSISPLIFVEIQKKMGKFKKI
ncbi:MAG: cation-translocating P-type ATPase [Candidatus Cellulosilyticum pullistercoris]|uniref:P-type Ca(2+) transporter n=1 Tax=Candidatus Cellulosilyticum pullistercoris TaxID=2838521 RepID=A0A9E2NLR7_9FIRM|nr:cation-translocating P-type ATPase [Candidatus Cellulosilyticum pullistercoris]